MYFCFHDPGQITDMPECGFEIGSTFHLFISGNEILDTSYHRTQTTKVTECLMSPVWQINAVLSIKQPFNEALPFLAAYLRKIGPGGLVTVLRRSPVSLCYPGFKRERADAAQV